MVRPELDLEEGMTRQTRLGLALVVALALVAAACGGEGGDVTTTEAGTEPTTSEGGAEATTTAGSATTAVAGESVTIGYSAPFLFSPFELLQQEATVAEAEALGFTVLPATNADGDSAKQDSDIRNLISAGAQGLIVVANDSNAIVPTLDYAEEQGVEVVSIDIGPDGGNLAMIVRANNLGMGAIACEALAEVMGYEGKVLSLQGAFATINGRERSEGFAECMSQYPDIELIERPTEWDPDQQVAALQTVLTANPDLKAFFQQSDYALDATLNVLTQAGLTAPVGEEGHIYSISVDATPRALELIRDGVLYGSISQPLDLYAKYGVEYLAAALDGQTFEVGPTDHGSEIVEFNGNLMDLIPAVLVTADNVDDDGFWANQVEE